MFDSFSDLIAEWPSLTTLSRDTGAKWSTVSKWKQRNNIPLDWWEKLIVAADRRGIEGVTNAELLRLAQSRREPAA